MKTAKRLETFDAYLGTAMNVILTRMKGEGKDIINLGLGDPDTQPPEHLRKALSDACMEPDHHHYPSFYSQGPLKEAISVWYRSRDRSSPTPGIGRGPLSYPHLPPRCGRSGPPPRSGLSRL